MAWNFTLPILISWPLLVFAGLLGERRPLGWLGATIALVALWVVSAGLALSAMFKSVRFLRVQDIPETYAFLDPAGVGGPPWQAAVSLHLGMERIWLSTLFGVMAGWAVISFARARPEPEAPASATKSKRVVKSSPKGKKRQGASSKKAKGSSKKKQGKKKGRR
jgi:hypothetical protein